MPDRDSAVINLNLELTQREAEMLTAGACEHFHRMRDLNAHEIYGALIISKNVLAAREVWQKLEEVTRIGEWPTSDQLGT